MSEELARKYFGGAQAIGQHFRERLGDEWSRPIEIVGITANTKESSLREEARPILYFALSQRPIPDTSYGFAIRTAGAPLALIPAVKAALAEIDPRFSFEIATLQQRIDQSVRLPRTLGLLAGFFGVLALVLASIGLYGLMSYTVARRTSEIGIRIALGAHGASIMGLVLGDVGRMVAAGLGLGALLLPATTKILSRFLFGVGPNDPATVVVSALALASVAFGAAMVPARRAARLNPTGALREE